MLWLWLVGCRPPVPDVRLAPNPATTGSDLEVQPAPGVGDRFTYEWAADGEVKFGLVGDRVPADRLQRGQRWTVDVVRWRGGRASAPRRLETRVGNGAPEAWVVIEQGPAGLNAVVVADDPDDDPVTTRVEWRVDGSLQSVLTGVSAARLVAGDTWTVTAWANDGQIQGPPATAHLTVDETPPHLTRATIAPDPPIASSELMLTVVPPPPAGHEVVAEWYVDDELVGSGPTLSPGVVARADNVWARVWTTDGERLSAPIDTPVVRVANSPPTLTGAQITPPVLAEGVIARCEPLGFADADGDPAAVDVRWFVDFVYVGRGETLTSADFDRGDQVLCEARPVDPESIGEPAASAPVDVVNTPPTLAQVVLEPASPVTGDVPQAVAIGTYDADDDDIEVAFTWFVDGLEVGSGDTFPGVAQLGDEIVVESQPYDGEATGVVVPSEPYLVGNAPPVLSAIAYLPDPPRADQPLAVSFDVVDPEGDTPVDVLIRWDIDGVVTVADELPVGALQAGQVVTAELQATDPFGAGPIVSGPPVTVQ